MKKKRISKQHSFTLDPVTVRQLEVLSSGFRGNKSEVLRSLINTAFRKSGKTLPAVVAAAEPEPVNEFIEKVESLVIDVFPPEIRSLIEAPAAEDAHDGGDGCMVSNPRAFDISCPGCYDGFELHEPVPAPAFTPLTDFQRRRRGK